MQRPARRVSAYALTGGTYVYRTYPEIDGLLSGQVNEQSSRVRTQILHKTQQILHDRVMFAPVLEPAFLNGVGPRVANSGLGAKPALLSRMHETAPLLACRSFGRTVFRGVTVVLLPWTSQRWLDNVRSP